MRLFQNKMSPESSLGGNKTSQKESGWNREDSGCNQEETVAAKAKRPGSKKQQFPAQVCTATALKLLRSQVVLGVMAKTLPSIVTRQIVGFMNFSLTSAGSVDFFDSHPTTVENAALGPAPGQLVEAVLNGFIFQEVSRVLHRTFPLLKHKNTSLLFEMIEIADPGPRVTCLQIC